MREHELEFISQFLVESDAIEGIHDDPDVIRQQLRGGTIDSPDAVPGHLRALLMLRGLVRQHRPVDKPLVKATQMMIVQDQHLHGDRKLPIEQRGEWRTHNVVIVSSMDVTRPRRRIGSDWQRIPADMKTWLADARLLDVEHGHHTTLDDVLAIARLHWRYERIHPFADGNGRSGRALALYQYWRAGLGPFVFTHHDRGERYYPCFERADASLMERYFLDRTAAARAAS